MRFLMRGSLSARTVRLQNRCDCLPEQKAVIMTCNHQSETEASHYVCTEFSDYTDYSEVWGAEWILCSLCSSLHFKIHWMKMGFCFFRESQLRVLWIWICWTQLQCEMCGCRVLCKKPDPIAGEDSHSLHCRVRSHLQVLLFVRPADKH